MLAAVLTRSLLLLALFGACRAAAAPASQPAHTHRLRLESPDGRASNYLIWLPDDWETNAVSGKRWYDYTRDPDQSKPPQWEAIEFKLVHAAGGRLELDLCPGALDVRFTVELSRVGDHYEGPWKAFAAFGADGRPSDRSGAATLRAVRTPATAGSG